MAALIQDKLVESKVEGLLRLKIGAVKMFKGALAMVDTDGYIKPAAPKAGVHFAGVVQDGADNSGGVAGAKDVMLEQDKLYLLDGTGFTIADTGKTVYALNDNELTLTEGTNSKPKVGVIVQVESSVKVWVKLMPYSGTGAGA